MSNPSELLRVPVSVVVLTMNERQNIERCLKSISWADDILVMDSGSTDGTVEAATELGARVLYRQFDHFAGQRNYALEHGELRHPWVLHIDADETVDDALRHEIEQILQTNPSDLDAWHVPFKLMFMEQWLKHAGMYPSYQVRVGHRDRLRFKMIGHGQREDLPPKRVSRLNGHLVHYNFSKGVTEWFIKHARYARDEALEECYSQERVAFSALFSGDALARRRALKSLSSRLPLRPFGRFIYMYVLKAGFLDGRAGFNYCVMIMIYQMMIDVNHREAATDLSSRDAS